MSRSLRKFLQQEVVWEQMTGQNGFGKASYAAMRIPARKEAFQKEVRDGQGKSVVSHDRIFCEAAVTVEDLIDGKKVLSVKSLVDGKGKVIGMEVLT